MYHGKKVSIDQHRITSVDGKRSSIIGAIRYTGLKCQKNADIVIVLTGWQMWKKNYKMRNFDKTLDSKVEWKLWVHKVPSNNFYHLSYRTKIAKAKKVKKEKFGLATTISSTRGLHPNISIIIYD